MKATAELASQDTLLANITSPFAVVTRDHYAVVEGTVLIRLNGAWYRADMLHGPALTSNHGGWAGEIYAVPAKSITLTA